jgi:hypothetical protein
LSLVISKFEEQYGLKCERKYHRNQLYQDLPDGTYHSIKEREKKKNLKEDDFSYTRRFSKVTLDADSLHSLNKLLNEKKEVLSPTFDTSRDGGALVTSSEHNEHVSENNLNASMGMSAPGLNLGGGGSFKDADTQSKGRTRQEKKNDVAMILFKADEQFFDYPTDRVALKVHRSWSPDILLINICQSLGILKILNVTNLTDNQFNSFRDGGQLVDLFSNSEKQDCQIDVIYGKPLHAKLFGIGEMLGREPSISTSTPDVQSEQLELKNRELLAINSVKKSAFEVDEAAEKAKKAKIEKEAAAKKAKIEKEAAEVEKLKNKKSLCKSRLEEEKNLIEEKAKEGEEEHLVKKIKNKIEMLENLLNEINEELDRFLFQ